MGEIEQLEQVLGQEYGIPPNIRKNNAFNRAYEYLKASGFRKETLLDSIELMSLNGNCFYIGKTHTLFPPNIKGYTQRMYEYSMLHEFCHGYVQQRNTEFQDLSQMSGRAGLEKSFIMRAVDEGIAHYVASASQKFEVSNGRPGEDVFCYNWERKLAFNDAVKPDDVHTESPMLSKDIALTFKDTVNKFFDEMASPMKTGSNKEVMGRIRRIGVMMETETYQMGYYFLRAMCKDRITDLAELIDPLIYNPIETIDELHDTVMTYF